MADTARSRLPAENPVCVHDWELDVCAGVWFCIDCGYEIRESELWEPSEGEVRGGE